MPYARLSAHDNSFLELEDAHTPMHIGGAFLFEDTPLRSPTGGIDIDRIQALVSSRLHRIPRYRQRIEHMPVTGHPIWVDDERFNIHYHVRHAALPEPGDERQLKRLCGRILSQQLDRGKPLWEIWVVEGLQDDRVALVTKVHHCMVDGASSVDLLQLLLSLEPEKVIEDSPGYFPEPPPGPARLLRDEVFRRLAQPFQVAGSLLSMLRDPAAAREQAEDLIQGVVSNLAVSLQPTDDTPINRPVGPHRRFDWLAMDLGEVKRVKNALGGTVNDVVLACTAGAMRSFLARRGVRLDRHDFEFRAICPVSVRTADEQSAGGNRVASMVVKLPVTEADPARRLELVCETTRDVKESKQALGGEVLAGVSEMTAPTLMTVGMRAAFDHRTSNMIVTNVPGPQIPLYLLGARMLETYPMVPLYPTQALNVALFSYMGGI
ncbi:MAG: wax ester/triacylglycerol synthase family O-acyltransferase, partial [Myxococcota bacterium]